MARLTGALVQVAGNSSDHGRSVTSKVVSLLDAFLPASRELSLNELASRTGLPISTTYRLATQLVEWGGLERGANGGYRIGLLLQEIGTLAVAGGTLQAVITPFMQDLHEATHENVQLAILSGQQALYIGKINSSGHAAGGVGGTGVGAVGMGGASGVGVGGAVVGGVGNGGSGVGGAMGQPGGIGRASRLPLHATGVGKVLLAHAVPGLVDDLIAAGLKRYTEHTIVAGGPLRRALAEIRRTGVGFSREELTLGSVSVAAPVFDANGSVVAAISLVLRSSKSSPGRLAPAVLAISLSASRELRSRSIRVGRVNLSGGYLL